MPKKNRNLSDLAKEINDLSSDERQQKILTLLRYVHDHPERNPNDEPSFYVF